GVVKAGAAYAAIDPDGSAGQLAVLLDGSSVALAVSRAEDADAPGLQGREWLDLAELAAEADSAAPISDAERGCPVRVANLAYVVGPAQSGERAGPVAMPQSGAAGLVAAFGKVTGTLDDDPDTRILHLAKPGTDRAFAETAWAVTMGHTLVIVAPGSESGGDLGEILDAGEVTDLMVTPGDLDSVDPDSAEYVRNLILVAASCPDEVVVQWQARGRRLFTAYDDAGMMGSVTRSRVTGRAPITAGRPVDGVAVRVLGEHATAVRAGETGALAFAGSGLARGYLGAAAETAARFVADPCGEPGTRMYRASECGRIVEDHLEIVVEGSE
ncbi:AMP-binding protein, partial [Gordonia sp. (in: high G+C Gram-positive bacteria)]|uniref:AMP-binding protein n=1 Tax=Gordonia sp. (in: high G+C Gram-positive bacteria) TaxID=84139 RepID=UPI0026187182